MVISDPRHTRVLKSHRSKMSVIYMLHIAGTNEPKSAQQHISVILYSMQYNNINGNSNKE